MIEEKSMGIKIAENPEEKKWIDIKEKIENSIISAKIEKEINDTVLKLADSKIKK